MNEKDDDLRPATNDEMIQHAKELIDSCETEDDYKKMENFMGCAIIIAAANLEVREGVEQLLENKAKEFGLKYKRMSRFFLKQSDKKILALAKKIVRMVYKKVLAENI